MGVAHHKPNPLGLERAAHVLFHLIEERLNASLEIRLVPFNVRTVAHKVLSHCCPLLSGERRVAPERDLPFFRCSVRQPILSRNSSTALPIRVSLRVSATVRSGLATYQPSAVTWC